MAKFKDWLLGVGLAVLLIAWKWSKWGKRQWRNRRGVMRRLWVRLLWAMGIKGKLCQCGFHEASHYYLSLEFDMEDYPCNQYRRPS